MNPLPLPPFSPSLDEIEMPAAELLALRGGRVQSQEEQYPPIAKMPDGRLIVESYEARNPFDGMMRCFLWRREDHPNLLLLPEHTPRAVKALYRADGQLAYLRGNYGLARQAHDAWVQWRFGLALEEARRRFVDHPNIRDHMDDDPKDAP
jgi:hypothetical protein